MHRLSFFVIFTTLVLTVIVFLIVPPPSGLQATATQNSVLSLFSEDICALPCWFGITPGESTSEDVEVFLQANEDIFTSIETSERSVFDTQTGSMLDGTYRFRWIESERDDIRYSGNWIEIRDGVVGEMRITMNSIVTLQETLDTLGSPNHVRLGLGYYTGDAILGLIYLNPHVRVDLKSQGCVTSQQIQDSFWIDVIHYYPPLETYAGHMPWSFSRHTGDDEREVPLELWQSWLNGDDDVYLTCEGGWETLPEVVYPTAAPTMMTLTPSMTETPTRVAP